MTRKVMKNTDEFPPTTEIMAYMGDLEWLSHVRRWPRIFGATRDSVFAAFDALWRSGYFKGNDDRNSVCLVAAIQQVRFGRKPKVERKELKHET